VGLSGDFGITLAVASKANMDIAGDAANGLYCCIAWFDANKTESAQAKAFDAAYTPKYGEPASFNGAYPYSALTVLAEGIRRTPSGKPEDVRNTMMQITDLETVAGVVSATEKGDFPLPIEIMRWDGKMFVKPD
jgi:ABC-type branched-subunit amino acid transport system substrate-binding protein